MLFGNLFWFLFLLSKHLGSRGERWTGSRQSGGGESTVGVCFETLKHLFTTSPQQCYAPTVWALESHWWQMRPDETSAKNISKHTLSLFLYSYESTKDVSEIQYLFSSKMIHLSVLVSLSHFYFLFVFVYVWGFFFSLDCKRSAARRQERPPVRWGQSVGSATGKKLDDK